jgi:hypothetical protein
LLLLGDYAGITGAAAGPSVQPDYWASITTDIDVSRTKDALKLFFPSERLVRSAWCWEGLGHCHTFKPDICWATKAIIKAACRIELLCEWFELPAGIAESFAVAD